MEKVWMSHPNLPGQTIEVPKSAASVHSHSGWVPSDPPEVERPEDKALAELESEKPANTSDIPQKVTPVETADEPETKTPETSEEPTSAKRVRRANTPKGDDE